MIPKARTAFVPGMGSCSSAMYGFYYVGRMAIPYLFSTRHPASLPHSPHDLSGVCLEWRDFALRWISSIDLTSPLTAQEQPW